MKKVRSNSIVDRFLGEEWVIWRDNKNKVHFCRLIQFKRNEPLYVVLNLSLIVSDIIARQIILQFRNFPCPFKHAANLAGINWMRLREWLDRRLIHVDANALRPNQRKHRRFSWLDIMRLSVIGQLASFGFEIEEASELFEKILGQTPKPALRHIQPGRHRFIRYEKGREPRVIYANVP